MQALLSKYKLKDGTLQAESTTDDDDEEVSAPAKPAIASPEPLEGITVKQLQPGKIKLHRSEFF